MRRIVDRVGLNLSRRLRRSKVELCVHEIELRSSAGYRIAATLFVPAGAGPIPAVVLCPGSDHHRQAFYGRGAPIRASEVASLGCAVLIFDPSGRGESWGPEDFGGAEHQDNVVTAVRYLRSTSKIAVNGIGLVGISLGVACAVGGARRLAESGHPVDWLIDWEGPCDQRTITANQTMNAPAMGHKSDDTSYWSAREAVRHVGHMRAGYLRLQADPDHAQPGELEHAMDMLRAANAGGLPWIRLNAHPVGVLPHEPVWLRSGPLAANRALIRALQSLIHRS